MAARRHVCRYHSNCPVEAQFLPSPQASQFQNIAPQVRAREKKNTISLFQIKKIDCFISSLLPSDRMVLPIWTLSIEKPTRSTDSQTLIHGHLAPSSDFFFCCWWYCFYTYMNIEWHPYNFYTIRPTYNTLFAIWPRRYLWRQRCCQLKQCHSGKKFHYHLIVFCRSRRTLVQYELVKNWNLAWQL